MASKIKNEKKFKCIPQQLSMSDASPFCQPWSYASDHAMEHMLSKPYFRSESDRLRPGDTIRVVQMEQKNVHSKDNSVLAFADVTIITSSRDGVEMNVGKITTMGEDAPTLDTDSADISEIAKSVNELAEGMNVLEGGFNEMSARVESLETIATAPDDTDQNDNTAAVTLNEGEVVEIKWNASKREHEALAILGEDSRVLFSSKKKDEVETWLQKSGLSIAQDGK